MAAYDNYEIMKPCDSRIYESPSVCYTLKCIYSNLLKTLGRLLRLSHRYVGLTKKIVQVFGTIL